MRTFWAPILVAAALAAAPATARGDVPVGSTPPSLGNFEVVHGDPFTDLKGLKGRVVQLVFFATWWGPCNQEAPGLQKNHEANKDKGLLIVAVSDEPKATIEAFIKKHGCTYTFISSREAEKNYGVTGYPTEFIIDAKGKVAGSGIDSLLGDCDVPPAADYSKKLDNARKAIRLGDYKAAEVELAKLEKEAGKDGENAKALEKWIGDHGTKQIAQGDAARDAGDVFGARDLYAEVTRKWGPKDECVKTAKEKLSELQKDAKKALAQEKLWVQAQAAEDAKDKAAAAALYAKCAKGAAGTKFADFCEKKAKDLK